MTRLSSLFASKQNILNIYCTAGYPQLNDTMVVMKALQDGGADIIELGMPYSDPLADGEVIQASSSIAITNGMSIPVLFNQLKTMRARIHVPVILMGYLNPVLQYGFEKFCADASLVGIDGLIIPDMPAHEFENSYREICERYALDFIFLVTPATPESRVRYLDRLSSGFVYAVSASSTTGTSNDLETMKTYLERLHHYKLSNPVLVGFGISDKESYETVCGYAHGAVIGSAYIKAIEDSEDIVASTDAFLSGFK